MNTIPHTILKHPVTTEKAMRLMESENKIIFVVDKRATKPQIKQAIETLFKAKVASVNTHIAYGRKQALITLKPETRAIDIATNLGLV